MKDNFSTTLDSCWIAETTRPYDSMQIQFMPNTINYNRSNDLNPFQVVGRNNPFYNYTGGNDTLNFKLDLYASDEEFKTVIQKINWLKSISINKSSNKGFTPVTIIFGDLFENDTWLLEGFNSQLTHLQPVAGFLPQRASVNCRFVLQNRYNRNANYYRKLN